MNDDTTPHPLYHGIRPVTPDTSPSVVPDVPGLTSGSEPVFDDADGDVFGPIPVAQAVSYLMDGNMANVEIASLGTGNLWVTESRVVVIESEATTEGNPGRDRAYLAGHMRHPWVIVVAYQPQRGLFGIPQIILQCFEAGQRKTFKGLVIGRLSIGFPRGTQVVSLAGRIARLIGAHNAPLVQDGRAAAAFRAVAEIGDPPMPRRGQMMPLVMPASVKFPLGNDGPWVIQTDEAQVKWGLG